MAHRQHTEPSAIMDEELTSREDLKRPWDTCREVPVIEDEHTPWKMIKLLKIISLFLVAITVFGLALCSKTSFLLLITLSHEETNTLLPGQKPVALLCIGCSLIAPSVLRLIKGIWKACNKTSKLPRKKTAALVLFFEFIVSFGVSVLTIVAMPHFDIVTNVTILNGVAVTSALLQAVAQCTSKERNGFMAPSIIAIVVLFVGYSLFVALYILKDVKMAIWVGLAVGGSILASFNWWENYFKLICQKKKKSVFLQNLFEDLTKCQNMLHFLSSLVRIAVTACVLGAYVPLARMDWVAVTSIPGRETFIVGIIIGAQLISSALCHWFALAACKMHVVRRCFILPLHLASLAVMALLIIPVVVYYEDYKLNMNMTHLNFTGYCFGVVDGRHRNISDYLFPQLVLDVTQTLCILDLSSITNIGLLTGAAACWWIGLVLATLYIWFLNVDRIQKTQDLFIRRLYEGAFIEQSLLLNTRFYIPNKNRKKTRNDGPAMVFLCATMWHETQDEIMNIMISIFRLDKYRPKNKPQFDDFNFEAHIYFDDAFENVAGSQERHLNCYAETLVKIITEVYGIFKNLDETFFGMQQHVPEQKIIRTPYGARLVATMPHGNNIVVHFKDKQLIRNKKRWSQVMYLYYLLGWKLLSKHYSKWKMGSCDEKKAKSEMQKEKHNTYILALDGDTDFQPASVMLLIDRLKIYPGVGAACGRIHPTGSGPAVWFQKFEYAVSHWLQKTAEHVFGCVLCSPGCFSLFRAEALMDDNVMKRYSTKSTEASHYIQYDQGEDRWLCTLMLKQGWRVEYNAASDAYTNAPQDFKELYNQRKRWGPSTMANVVDLLGSTNIISKKNPSMSKPFMFYQLFATISAILAPATICLMVAGSLTFLVNMPSALALVLSVIPPVIFLGLCFKLKADTQITIAAVLSIMYAFLMLAVTISIIASMVKEQTILTPSSLFIIIMSLIYIVTALLHPQELPLAFYGLLYTICIPSAYLLLTIYSMVNMNSVSWGTRETKPAAGADAAATSSLTKKQKAKNTFQRLFSWMKCCKKCHQRPEDAERGVRQEHLVPESMQLEPQPQNTIVDDVSLNEQEEIEMVVDSPVDCWKRQLQGFSSDIKLEEDFLEVNEEAFWYELIKKYLEPLQTSKEEQEQTRDDLRDLRNKINFSFFFLNALWLVAVFIFQLFSSTVIEVDLVDINLHKTGKKLTIEPLGLMFILGFALSVLLQFVGMLLHRINTLVHYIAFLETEPKQQRAAEKMITSPQEESSSNTDSNYDSHTHTNPSLFSEDLDRSSYDSHVFTNPSFISEEDLSRSNYEDVDSISESSDEYVL